MSTVNSGDGFDVQLPRSLRAERRGEVAILSLARPQKRNAIDDPTVLGIEAFFAGLPDAIKAAVIAGEGDHFCSGLDLGELSERDIAQGIAHSRSWHRAFERIEFGKVPVVAVLHGAVVGGGLEIAAACHIRVAEGSAYYALPEGSRGIFVGGGGSVRLPRLIGTARMIDMMLTGRVYDAAEGQAIGISQLSGGARRRIGQRHRAGDAHRRQCSDDQFRGHPCIAADRAIRSCQRLYDRGADLGDSPGRRRSEGAAQGLSRKAGAEDGA